MNPETRLFESVDQSPEVIAANKAYFEAQGVEAKVETSETGDQVETPPATPAGTPPAAAAPSGTGEADDTVVDAETAADWESAHDDGRRKSRYAKKRQEARELKASNERLERELAELKAKPAAPAEPKPGDIAPPAAGGEANPPAAAAPDANAEEKFSEAEPPEPQYADFAAEDDQLLAYNQALAKHGREWSRWDRRREKFEDGVAAAKARKAEQAQTAQNERLTKLGEALTEVRTQHPDFDTVTDKGNVFSLAIQGVSTVLPGGLNLVYQLAKDPVKLKQFNDATAETVEVNGKKVPTQRAWDLAIFMLGQVAGPSAAAPPAAGSPPAAAPSGSSKPREEPAAPTAARGRASAEPTRDNLTGDQRRDMLAKQLA